MTIESNTSLSKEDRCQLETEIENSLSTINKENKFKIISGNKNYFLPRYKDVMSFFNEKFDMQALYKHADEMNISLPNISHGSLHQLYRKGVGKSVFKKAFDIVGCLDIFPIQLLLKGKDEWIDRSCSVCSHAFGWFVFINQYNMFKKDKNLDQDELSVYQYLIAFIESRCQQEIICLEQMKNSAIVSNITPCFSVYTQIDSANLVLIEEILSGSFYTQESTEQRKNAVIESILICEYDFFLNAIACYELGYVHITLKKVKLTKWLISNMLEVYVSDKNSSSCFRCLIDVLQDWFKQNNIEMNSKKLASCIEWNFRNSDNDGDEDKAKIEAQYNVLYKWYRSVDLPSNELLQSFLNNLAILTGCAIDNGIFDVSKLAISLDKTYIEKKAYFQHQEIGNIDLFPIWKKVWSRYGQCYEYQFQQYINNG